MSGICAVWHKKRQEYVASTLAAVSARLKRTAGSRDTMEIVDGVGLAVQPHFSGQQIFRSGHVVVACDAELLNEEELRNVVACTAESCGTAAVLAGLYERYGDGFVEKLRGSFSVVLWDRRKRRLVAAIDGFGIGRLAWYEDASVLLIASRADALRAGTDNLKINPRAIANIVNFSCNLAPETIFANVQRLTPGMLLTASESQTRTTAYWDLRYGLASSANEESLSRELQQVMEQSIAAHCTGDSFSRLGAFLSGGTDSSTVLGLMTQTAGAPVKSFSIGFQEHGFNELRYAEIAARTFGSQHFTHVVNVQDCFDALPDIVRCFDEPFCNASAVPTYFCARLAAQNGVATMLAGDGGDELFGGNERYATEKIFEAYQFVPKILRAGVIERVARLPIEISMIRKLRGYVRRASMQGVERMLSFQFLCTHSLADVFDPDFLRSLDGYSVLEIPSRYYARASARDHMDRLLYVDMKITLGDNDLPKVTRMSELAGVRTRFPFLDHAVAEFSGRIPANLKVKGLRKRYLFKRAFRNLLPVEILRKQKHGFGIPVALWIKTDPRMRELTYDTLLSAQTLQRGYFRREFIREWFRKHEASDSTYYAEGLWTFLTLELWHRQVLEEPARVIA